MNNKGFTLIELLAVILLLALITAVAFPMVGNVLETSKKSSDKIFYKNVKSAAENYMEECLYGNETCTSGTATIKLSVLKDKGFLESTSDAYKNNYKDCNITIVKKEINTTKKVYFEITSSTNGICKTLHDKL